MLPNAADIEYFIEVAQTANISRAAERLGITQPSLSMSIKRLEKNLGTQLLLRSKTGVKLTPNGKRFIANARQLIDEWQKIKSATLKDREEVRGQYKIGCHPSVAMYSLPGFLGPLLKKHPELEIQLVHDLSRKITEQVISYNIDIALAVNPVAHPDLVIRELRKDAVTLWQGPKYDFKNDHSPILIFDPNLVQSQSIIKKLKSRKTSFARHMNSSNLDVICELVHNNVGIGILPTSVAQRQSHHKLKVFGDNPPTFSDSICMIYRGDAPKTAALKEIAEAIGQSARS